MSAYIARVSDDPAGHAHPVPHAHSPMEAAILFAETWMSGDGEVAVSVFDRETGHEHCFRIDLGDGEIAPC